MNIWFAGVPGGGKPGDCKREREIITFCNKRLHSYYHLNITKGILMKNKQVDLFLDSGAFSAFTQNIEIDINEYINFIKQHKEVVSFYANLDVIGDAKATYRNQLVMESKGISPLPVFHQGEDETYLKRYLKRGYPYICIGGLVGGTSSSLIPWLDHIFREYLCDEKGYPKVKVHGFGLTSLKLMLRYPWYSVDSTSWVMTSRMGGIYVPIIKKGKYVYDENSWKITVSSKSPAKKKAGAHIDSLRDIEKEQILEYIHFKGYKLGKSELRMEKGTYELKEDEKWASGRKGDKVREVEKIIEPGLCNDYKLRDEMNIIYFQDLEKSMPEWPWPFNNKRRKIRKGLLG